MVYRHGLICLAILIAGCKQKPTNVEVADGGGPAPTAPDHLGKGELAEGTEKAFGFPLPKLSTVVARFGTQTIHVGCDAMPEDVANYTRARVKDGTITPGTTVTRFDNVAIKADPKRFVSVEIRRAPMSMTYRSVMILQDRTPTPEMADPNISVEEKMRRSGLTPDGKLIDPKHMQ